MLSQWEQNLPARHKWSIWNLRGYKAKDLDLAYLSITMVLRLGNIILRRNFLDNIIHANFGHQIAPVNFWKDMSVELFQNVLGLHEQIEAFSSMRSRDQGYPAMVVFCLYISGSLANHLWRHPQLCPDIALKAESIVSKSVEVLMDLQAAWPLAQRWREALERTASSIRHGITTTALNTSVPPHENVSSLEDHLQVEPWPDNDHGVSSFAANLVQQNTSSPNHGQGHPTYNGIDVELTAFLDAEGQLGFLYDWDQQIF